MHQPPNKHPYLLNRTNMKRIPFTAFLMIFMASVQAQSLRIGQQSHLVIKGKSFLVVRNASLVNNGNLKDSSGTVVFSGHADTTISFFDGNKSTSVYNLSIQKSDKGTAIKAPLSVQHVLGVYDGNLYADSNLTLRSDANLTARVDEVPAGANIYGKAIVERYFPARRSWRLVTSPLKETGSIFHHWQNDGIYVPGLHTAVTGPNPTGASGNGLDASPQNNASLKTWNAQSQTLESVLNTHVKLSPGNNGSADNTGYFLFVRGDRDYNNFYLPNSNATTLKSSGVLQVGTQHFPASNTGGGYTLMGNPFASPVDMHLVQRINLVNRFYVWDPSLNVLGAYVMLDDLDGDGLYTKSINASAQQQHIQSSQAFFVETQSNGPAALQFTESCKSTGNNNAVFRPIQPLTGAIPPQSIRIVLQLRETDGNRIPADGVLVECREGWSNGIDRDDALKFGNVNENLALLRNGQSLTAERKTLLNENDTLFLKITRLAQRSYALSIEPFQINDPGLTAWLEDAYLGTVASVGLDQVSDYPFEVTAAAGSSAANRFRIVFKRLSPLPVSGIAITAQQSGNGIQVKWTMFAEQHIQSYEVERSVDGVHFYSLDHQQPLGNDGSTQQYQILDPHPATSWNYYRIRYILISAQIQFSTIVRVQMGFEHQSSIVVYPNPIQQNTIQLYFEQMKPGRYQLHLINAVGQEMASQIIQHRGGDGHFTMNPVVKLPAANYWLKIVDEQQQVQVVELMVQ